jgi:protein O-GlcNAc transferase
MIEIMLTLPEAIKRAMASHQAGDLTGAEQIYQKIIAAKPDHFDANHLLGLLRYQCGHHEEAERSIRLALATNPEDQAALCNLGVVLRELKRLDEALASFDKVIALRSDYATLTTIAEILLRTLIVLRKRSKATARQSRSNPITPRRTIIAEYHFNASSALMKHSPATKTQSP